LGKKFARETFEELLSDGEKPVGSFVMSHDTAATAIFGAAGYDFVVIDREHGMMSVETMVNHVRTARAHDLVPFVRVLGNDPTLIQQALDAGAQGIIVPKVGTAEEAVRAVAAAKYAPGGRGMCPVVPGADYGTSDWSGYSNRSNHNVIVIPLIETRAGVENIEAITAVEGIDFTFFGLADLSQDLGIDMIAEADEILRHWDTVARATIANGGHPGAPLGFGFDELADWGTIDGDLALLRATAIARLVDYRASSVLQTEQRDSELSATSLSRY
jgi:2-keto-3-deoxy-L-rhamnonate aldolase RhmA